MLVGAYKIWDMFVVYFIPFYNIALGTCNDAYLIKNHCKTCVCVCLYAYMSACVYVCFVLVFISY
jgi:hypothetical protein